ncbi:MAG: acetyl-CoA synthetase [Myxococcota bacterium]|nr:acetyl-CoA synthetase [Myxococcota bacterium]
MIDPRSPCLVGFAQRTVRPEEGDAPEPLELWAEMAESAARDSGGHDVIRAIDDVNVVFSVSWTYDDAPGRLAERLGLAKGGRHLSSMSGTSSQKMLTRAAGRILSGEIDLALVAGAESLATRKRIKQRGESVAWSHPPEQRQRVPFDDPFHPSELAHEIFQAYVTFAIFDVARRKHLGLSPDENLRQAGELFAPMTEVAAGNPNAWFRRQRSVEELIAVRPENRMVSHPYPKNLVAIMDVDMASGLLVASHEKADALGVPRDRRIYLRGWCEAKDPVHVAEREELWRSVAMEEVSRAAMSTAGIGIDDIAHLDLYSCFPSSVNFARDALGLAPADSRPLTVTGGLPYHGGPGSAYLGHSIASLAERLREDAGAFGMASGVGMHMANHSYAVYSSEPGPLVPPDPGEVQDRIDASGRRNIRDSAAGSAQVAAYSVVHGRAGPRVLVAVCELPGGDRCYARSESPDLMTAFESGEFVGESVELADAGKGVNRIVG